LQYDEKNKRLFKNKKNSYSFFVNGGLNKILCVYENIESAKLKLQQLKLKFSIKKDIQYGQRLETSVKNVGILSSKNYLPIFIYKDPGNIYDVDFDLI
jgi:hypothetical protein